MRDALWTRVEAALDARRSPFDDPHLAAELRREPEGARAVERLLAGLAGLGRGQRTRPRARRAAARWGWAIAAMVILGMGAWLVRREMHGQARDELGRSEFTIVVEHTTPPPPRGARVELAARRILAWKLEGETP